MRITSIVGVVLILAGVASLVWGGIAFTTRNEVADVGPVKIQTQETKHVPIPPLAGGAALVGGIVLVALGWQKS